MSEYGQQIILMVPQLILMYRNEKSLMKLLCDSLCAIVIMLQLQTIKHNKKQSTTMKLFSVAEGHSKTFLVNLKIKEMKLPTFSDRSWLTQQG